MESSTGIKCSSIFEPAVVRWLAVLSRSLTAIGIPIKGPSSPDLMRCVAFSAADSAASSAKEMNALRFLFWDITLAFKVLNKSVGVYLFDSI